MNGCNFPQAMLAYDMPIMINHDLQIRLSLNYEKILTEGPKD